MSLTLEQISSGVCQLRGDVNVNTITKIIVPGYRMIDAVPPGQTLNVDLAKVVQADSASIALLLDWLRHAKKHGKSLSFSNLPEKMKDMMKVSNLDGVLNMAIR